MDWISILFLWFLENIAQSEVSLRKNHNVDWMLVLFLRLLDNIAEEKISLKKKLQCKLDVAFASMITRKYSPIRGLIQEKVTMGIECSFCFYGYWRK